MLKKLELNEEMHRKLISYCNTKKIIFLSSPFDIDSIKLLNNLGLEKFKIPSGEITNLQYLSHIGKLNKKVILSTGMANIREVGDALNVLINSGTKKKNIIVLHANTEYPTPKEDVNLNAMVKMGKVFDISYGYSDHTLGIEVSIAATALGAVCIEKHFTLNRNMKGPDHKASLEPNELNSMVKSIRNIEIALGSEKKKPTKSEKPNIKIVRKSLVAAQDIKRGEFFSEQNLTAKRPGNGKSPFLFKKLVGKKSQKNYKKDQQI
jgi:N,N'-diacetyllegionaminate synthase